MPRSFRRPSTTLMGGQPWRCSTDPHSGCKRPPAGRRTRVPDGRRERRDSIWLAYVPLEAAHADIAALTVPRKPTFFAGPEQPWERLKIGGGPSPVLTPHGWLLGSPG